MNRHASGPRSAIGRAIVVAASLVATANAAEFREGRAFVFGYHLDSGGFVIAELSETGQIARTFGAPFMLQNVTSLVFLPDGTLAAVAGVNSLMFVFDAKAKLVGIRQMFASSSGGATLSDDGHVVVASPAQDSLCKVTGGFTSTYSLAFHGASLPYDVEFDPRGRAVYTSSGTDRIHRYDFPLGSTAEELGDDASCADVRRLTVTPMGDIFAIRNGADTVTYVSEDGSTIESLDIEADTPTDLAMAPDGTVAILSGATHEIIHVDPIARSVTRRVALPDSLLPLYFAYAPARFAVSVKGVSVDGENDQAPVTVKMAGVEAAYDAGAARLTLDLPYQYAADDLVSSFLAGPQSFRLLSPGASAGSPRTSGFGGISYQRTTLTAAIEFEYLPGNVRRTKRVKGAFDHFDAFQSHFTFQTTKKLK